MNKKNVLIAGLSLMLPVLLYGQQLQPNQFKLGMMGAGSTSVHWVNGCDVPFETTTHDGNPTSVLNVLTEDGFNIVHTYEPTQYTTEASMKSFLKLVQAHGLRAAVGNGHYYKPAIDADTNSLGYGVNMYDNCGQSLLPCQSPYSQNYFRTHIPTFINKIYTQTPYKNIVWGYQIAEEASYLHYFHFTNDCHGNVWQDTHYFVRTEIPPVNVRQAIAYYKSRLADSGITDHKIILMEANHGKLINAGTNDGIGIYNPQDYYSLLSPNDSRDLIFEGSYNIFPGSGWIQANYADMYNNVHHYLAPFKSIEYAGTHAREVHKILNTEGKGTHDNFHILHSDLGVPNGNWLWFQAYNSIIHGASGIWFWELNVAHFSYETNYWTNTGMPQRYQRTYFPIMYRNYVSYLARELRYLINNNILSTDPQTVIASKTDGADIHCIVPPAASYIPLNLPADKRTELYGLRYTIRSNGAETYMIITNPLNVPLSATLNFATCANPQIQHATGVQVLFDNNQYPVNSSSYKMQRNTNVNLTGNTVGSQYYTGFINGKQLTLSFGPMDVKVLKFTGTMPDHNNGWNRVWSNAGNGQIDGHTVGDDDRYYTGDFDGDGTEELLCVSTNGWMNMLKYTGSNWSWHWSNYGSALAGNGIYPYRDHLIAGDFDGDGRTDLLGNAPNGYVTLFRFVNGDWQWTWSNYGSSAHAIWPYRDRMYAGDFDGDGKTDILGCGLPNGWTASFKWSGSDFVRQWSDSGTNHPMRPYRSRMLPGDFDGDGKTELLGLGSWATLFHFDNGNWQWGWSNGGANLFNGWPYPLAATDQVLAGQLDQVDRREELLFLETDVAADLAASMDLKANQSGWNWNWSANSYATVPYIDDWSLAPEGGTNTRYLLLRAKAGEPECLLAMRKYCNRYLVQLYARNDHSNYKPLSLEETRQPGDDHTIRVFPNPSRGMVGIRAEQQDLAAVEVSDVNGRVVISRRGAFGASTEVDLTGHPHGIYFVKITTSAGSVAVRKLTLGL